jgi:hypothetical protein
MTLSEEARSRLADIVELQPTKNGVLQERWDLDSGSEVHRYLESELGEYYYRDDNSLIRATEEAASLVGVAPGVEAGEGEGELIIRVGALEAACFEVLEEPEGEPQSVVGVMNAVEDRGTAVTAAEDVEEALQALRRKDVVEVVYRTVPGFRRAVPGDAVDVEVRQD